MKAIVLQNKLSKLQEQHGKMKQKRYGANVVYEIENVNPLTGEYIIISVYVISGAVTAMVLTNKELVMNSEELTNWLNDRI